MDTSGCILYKSSSFTSKLGDKDCVGAPDWIIDIDKQRITVHNFENQTLEEYSFSDIVKAGIYDDLYIDFSNITE